MNSPLQQEAAMQHGEICLIQLLIRYWSPFWLFKDASRGDMYARAAAYRNNRMKRIYLPGYLLKWIFVCGVALGLTEGFELLARDADGMKDVLFWITAGWAVVFVFGVCVLMVTSYAYLYLSQNE